MNQMSKNLCKIILVLCFVTIANAYEYNNFRANHNYPNSPVENFVVKQFGDKLPHMHDDLINRKNNGENFIERHYNSWKNTDNWRYEPEHRRSGFDFPDYAHQIKLWFWINFFYFQNNKN